MVERVGRGSRYAEPQSSQQYKFHRPGAQRKTRSVKSSLSARAATDRTIWNAFQSVGGPLTLHGWYRCHGENIIFSPRIVKCNYPP